MGKKKITTSVPEAEATGANIYFEWESIPLVIDLTKVQFGRWTYALRRVGNTRLSTYDRFQAAFDVFEAALGEDQVAMVADQHPDLFDNMEKLESFWDTFVKASHSVSPGESSAS